MAPTTKPPRRIRPSFFPYPMNYLVLGSLVAASLAVAAYKLQFYLIYASHFPEGSRDHVATPDGFGMPFEDVKLLTPDGENIHLYVIPAEPRARKTVLFLGPNAGNMGDALPAARLVHKLGLNVVMLSYRGYGKSTGSASEQGLKADVDATIKYIVAHPQLCGTQLILYGRSLGGAVAIYAASNAGKKYPLAGVMLENTFTSIPKLVPHVMPLFANLTMIITQRWQSEKLIGQISPDLPMLFMAGGQDELIPPSMFSELYKKCSSRRKSYNLYPAGTHNDTIAQQGYWDDMAAFFDGI